MENRTVSLWIKQSGKSRTVSVWMNQSEKKSRTVSLWKNQSENVPCQRVRKRDEPAKQENRRRTVSTFIENVINRHWKNFVIFQMEFFCLTMMYFLKKFRTSQTRFSRKSKKNFLQSERISKRRGGRYCMMREEKAFSKEKENLTSRTKLCCFKEYLFLVGLLSRWYRSKS